MCGSITMTKRAQEKYALKRGNKLSYVAVGKFVA